MRRLALIPICVLMLLAITVDNGSGASASGLVPSIATTNLDSCIVELTGDVNLSGTLNSADIIYLVRYSFLTGATPLPCVAAGDVNCSGQTNTADVLFLVNHVFRSGAAPCDVCTIIDSIWAGYCLHSTR